jgi:hypothetical protein
MTFVKGQSGNPGGKPKISKEAKELARQFTAESINRLAQIMRQKADTKAALTAAIALIERGWGRAPQSLEMTGKDGGPIETHKITDTEAARLIAFTLAKAVQEDGPTVEAPGTETVQ